MLRILVVDDSRYQRFLVKRALAAFGECDEAEDGRRGLDLFQEALAHNWPYHAVVMDIMMPVMDGRAAVREMRRREEAAGRTGQDRSRYILLTSVDDPEQMAEAQFQDGADSYIVKPFEDAALAEALMGLGLIPNPLDEPCDGDWK